MDLWIRSQDRMNLEHNPNFKIEIGSQYKDKINNKIEHQWHIKCKNCILGTYLNLERTLEVLDEIQNLLKPKIKITHHEIKENKLNDFSREIIMQPIIDDIQFNEKTTCVYEMPSN